MAKRVAGTWGRRIATGALLGLSVAALVTPAEARHRHHSHARARFAHHTAGGYAPPYSAMVIDANSGRTLYAVNENELRHPASITKVMTLYLLFEQLEKGSIRLDSDIPISAHAASQEPSKLGLRPGSTIEVEAAIKSIVTKSCNDIAVAVAEALGGDEATFAQMMTRKAHALGMNRTLYRNASGLPNDEQWTTAHDLTVLGRAIQERFPRYYRYFSTHQFAYRGSLMRNHNHLMDRVEGMDGIKTGYTRASGFNLLTSVRRDSHHIVASVLGGKSAGGRDRIMADLIEENIDKGATNRTVSLIAETGAQERDPEPEKIAVADPVAPSASPSLIAPTMALPPAPSLHREEPVESRRVVTTPIAPIERARPAYVSANPRVATPDRTRPERRQPGEESATAARVTTTASIPRPTATPSTVRASISAHVVPRPEPRPSQETRVAKVEPKVESAIERRPGSVKGWVIQVGATDDAGKANALLARARNESRSTLSSARPFTEKVQKGEATLYRARFAGLAPEEAELACKQIKRSGLACFATHD